jgi:hypothetical protein
MVSILLITSVLVMAFIIIIVLAIQEHLNLVIVREGQHLLRVLVIQEVMLVSVILEQQLLLIVHHMLGRIVRQERLVTVIVLKYLNKGDLDGKICYSRNKTM